jgi:hypothetical protein
MHRDAVRVRLTVVMLATKVINTEDKVSMRMPHGGLQPGSLISTRTINKAVEARRDA